MIANRLRDRVDRSLPVVLVLLLVVFAAGCSLFAVPTATPLPPPPATSVLPLMVPPPTVAKAEIAMNLGGGIRDIPSGGQAIVINGSEITDTTTITVTLPSPCVGVEAVAPKLVVHLASDRFADLLPTADGRYTATIDAANPEFHDFYTELCSGTDSAELNVKWNCGGDGSGETFIGTLTCGELDLTGLVDPLGHVDLPNRIIPEECINLAGVRAELHQLTGSGVAALPGTMCDSSADQRELGWQIMSGEAPPMAGVDDNLMVGGNASVLQPPMPILFTNAFGFYAWNAAPGCYYVRLSLGSCVWHSETFGVDEPVIGLDFTLDLLQACAITPPACKTPQTLPTPFPTLTPTP